MDVVLFDRVVVVGRVFGVIGLNNVVVTVARGGQTAFFFDGVDVVFLDGDVRAALHMYRVALARDRGVVDLVVGDRDVFVECRPFDLRKQANAIAGRFVALVPFKVHVMESRHVARPDITFAFYVDADDGDVVRCDRYSVDLHMLSGDRD